MGIVYRDLVRKYSQVKRSPRTVLNMLADYATDDGLAWPKVEVLARECGLSVRAVQYALAALIQDGQLEVLEHAGGGRGLSKTYRLLVPEKGALLAPFNADKRVQVTTEKGASYDKRVQVTTEKGASYAEISYTREEPYIEPQLEPECEPRVRAQEPVPPRKIVRVTSPYLAKSHFVGDYIPAGTGSNPVEVYYERFQITKDKARLDPIQEDDLVRNCPDLAKLRDVVTAYHRRNYQPANVQLILDWYRTGIPINGSGPPSTDDMAAAVKATGARLAEEAKRTAERYGKRVDPVRGTIAHGR